MICESARPDRLLCTAGFAVKNLIEWHYATAATVKIPPADPAIEATIKCVCSLLWSMMLGTALGCSAAPPRQMAAPTEQH